jgi:hypothetical protein
MKRTYLFFALVASILTIPIMAGQRIEGAGQSTYQSPFRDFVSSCRDNKLAEHVSKYRAKIDELAAMNAMYGKGPAEEELTREIARQGDLKSLELLEKDLPNRLKKAVWSSLRPNDNTDDGNKLLVKWAIENPAEITLMRYHPNGVDLLIKTAEDKNASFDNRVTCLYFLGEMPGATKVLDRVRALMSDKTTREFLDLINVPGGVMPDIAHPDTIGSVAAETVKKHEALIQKQKKWSAV